MRITTLTVGLALLLAVPACTAADPLTIPTQTCRNYFLIPITLAPKPDQPPNRTLWFVYDTGAASSVVDPESVARVSTVTVTVGQTANLTNATAGPVTFKNLPAEVHDLDHLSHALGREIDGILAFTAFRDYLLTIDYAQGEIRLEKGSLPRPDGRTVLDAKGPDKRPWLKVEFSHRKRRLLLDSGAARSVFVVRELESYETVAAPRVTGVTFGLANVERRSSARASEPVRLGGFELTRPTLQSTAGVELIGGRVMRHFVWTFDQKKRRVRLVPNDPEAPLTFGPVLGHGLALGAHPDGFVVDAVLPDTPAARADIAAGDVVTHFDGVPVADRGCTGPADGPRAFSVTVRRDGAVREVGLAIEVLVE